MKKRDRLLLQRARRRGAALVEAALVLPVMIVFLGCIMFAHRAYDTKLDRQMATRAGTLYYASHNCEGDIPAELAAPSTQADDADPGLGNNPGDGAKGKLGNENSGSLNNGLSRAKAKARIVQENIPVNGSAVLNGKREGLTMRIKAASTVACNEKAYPSKWTAAVKFMKNFLTGNGLGI